MQDRTLCSLLTESYSHSLIEARTGCILASAELL